IGGVRGSHILLPQFAGIPDAAVYSEATDGRPIFVIPWNGQTLVGTTEVADSADPARTAPTAQEVHYLMQSFMHIFPNSGLTQRDIIASYAGVRPLPYVANSDANATTRKHFIHDHSDDGARGLLSLIGGKLTTATSLARECAKKLGVTASLEAPKILAAEGTPRDSEIAAAETLCLHTSHTATQAVTAARHELAVTLGDILLR